MDLSLWWVFLPACFAINLSPGPNNLLVMQSATQAGFSPAVTAASGRIISFGLLIVILSLGLASVLLLAPWFLDAVKTLGGLYLLWIAWTLWQASPSVSPAAQQPFFSVMAGFRREAGVALSNPKAILVFSAFLPQFVNPDDDTFPQMMQLGAAFLLLETLAIAFYALLGSRFAIFLATELRRQLFNRCCALLLAGAGITLLVTPF